MRIPNRLFLGKRLIETAQDIVSSFSNFFSTVFTQQSGSKKYFLSDSGGSINISCFTEENSKLSLCKLQFCTCICNFSLWSLYQKNKHGYLAERSTATNLSIIKDRISGHYIEHILLRDKFNHISRNYSF